MFENAIDAFHHHFSGFGIDGNHFARLTLVRATNDLNCITGFNFHSFSRAS